MITGRAGCMMYNVEQGMNKMAAMVYTQNSTMRVKLVCLCVCEGIERLGVWSMSVSEKGCMCPLYGW